MIQAWCEYNDFIESMRIIERLIKMKLRDWKEGFKFSLLRDWYYYLVLGDCEFFWEIGGKQKYWKQSISKN